MIRTSRARFASVVLAGSLAVVGLAACGDDDSSSDDTEATTDAAADLPPEVAALVGMEEADAEAAATEAGYTFEVIERDGEKFPATADFREDRVRVVVADGKVTSATVG